MSACPLISRWKQPSCGCSTSTDYCNERPVVAGSARVSRAGRGADHRAALHAHDDTDRTASAFDPVLARRADDADREPAIPAPTDHSPLHPASADRRPDRVCPGRAGLGAYPVALRITHPAETPDPDRRWVDQ